MAYYIISITVEFICYSGFILSLVQDSVIELRSQVFSILPVVETEIVNVCYLPIEYHRISS